MVSELLPRRMCGWSVDMDTRKLWEKISRYLLPHIVYGRTNIVVCRETCYPDFTPLEDWLVEEGKLQKEQVGWYATNHGPVAEFIAEGTRGVWMSETTPSKPFVVDWRLRRVDVICPFLPSDPKQKVIFLEIRITKSMSAL